MSVGEIFAVEALASSSLLSAHCASTPYIDASELAAFLKVCSANFIFERIAKFCLRRSSIELGLPGHVAHLEPRLLTSCYIESRQKNFKHQVGKERLYSKMQQGSLGTLHGAGPSWARTLFVSGRVCMCGSDGPDGGRSGACESDVDIIPDAAAKNSRRRPCAEPIVEL